MKLFTVLFCALCCAGFTMAGDYFPVKLTVAAAGTTATADVDLTQPAYGTKALEVDRVTACVMSGGGTGVVTFAAVDHGVATTISTSGSIKLADLYTGYPTRTITTTEVRNATLLTTNDTPIVVTTTNSVATSATYLLKTVRVSVSQAANPVATVYNAMIFVK